MDYYGNNDWRDYLAHHGILGMKWGRRNGPPYPLDGADHSASEKKAGWRKSLGGGGESSSVRKKNGKVKSKSKNRVSDSERNQIKEDAHKEHSSSSDKIASSINSYKKMGDYDGDDFFEEWEHEEKKRETRNKIVDSIVDDLKTNGPRQLTKDEDDIWDQVSMDYFYNTRHGDESFPGDHERNTRMSEVDDLIKRKK